MADRAKTALKTEFENSIEGLLYELQKEGFETPFSAIFDMRLVRSDSDRFDGQTIYVPGRIGKLGSEDKILRIGRLAGEVLQHTLNMFIPALFGQDRKLPWLVFLKSQARAYSGLVRIAQAYGTTAAKTRAFSALQHCAEREFRPPKRPNFYHIPQLKKTELDWRIEGEKTGAQLFQMHNEHILLPVLAAQTIDDIDKLGINSQTVDRAYDISIVYPAPKK